MKWMGQHIYNYVATFRQGVTMDSTLSVAGNLTFDSVALTGIQTSSESFANNDVSIMTSAAIEDKILSYGYGTGDITGVTITTDSGGGSAASDTAGSADFSILGANGVGVTNSGTTITAAAVPGEIDHDSLLNFASNEHFTQANITTVGTISTGVWNGTSIGTTYTDAKVTSIVAGDGIDVSGATGDVTVTAETATDSNPGVVELATTGEADTGTDTARAVTPAGLESHVSARYSYQYINFVGNSDIATNWATPTQNGSNSHNWSIDTGESGTTVGTTTITVGRQYATVGFTAPYAGQLMGFWGTMRNHNNNNQGSLGLFVAAGSDIWGATGTKAYTLRAMGSQSYAGGAGSSYTGGCKVDGILGSPLTLAQGDIIIPAVLEATADKVFFQMTMIIRTLIPT
tara:strand:+ start:118 stop:1323 length:1206 start_codon:yes stop_codon:yes gene_type:complete